MLFGLFLVRPIIWPFGPLPISPKPPTYPYSQPPIDPLAVASSDRFCQTTQTKSANIRQNPLQSGCSVFELHPVLSARFVQIAQKKTDRKRHSRPFFSRGDRIWTCDLWVPKNKAVIRTIPRLSVFDNPPISIIADYSRYLRLLKRCWYNKNRNGHHKIDMTSFFLTFPAFGNS